MYCQSSNFELRMATRPIPRCPVSKRHQQLHLYVHRLESARTRILDVLRLTDQARHPTGRLRVQIIHDPASYRRVCRAATGLVHQGQGTKRFHGTTEFIVHHDLRTLRDDASLHRHLVHNLTHLLVARIAPAGWIGNRGHGWLDAGLSHFFAALAVDGKGTDFCYHEAAQPPTTIHGGDLHRLATRLLAAGQLPPLASLIGKDLSDLDLGDHALAAVTIEYLIRSQDHGGAKLGQLLLAVKKGARAADAIEKLLGTDVDRLDRRMRAWLMPAGTKRARGSSDAATVRPVTRHATLYVYTRWLSYIRPRHLAVVKLAIQRRAAAHESGWAIRHRRPVLEIGPVRGLAAHWKGERRIKPIWATWPFVAVLEYDGRGQARARLDWYRRRRGNRDPGGWFKDPAGFYTEHINAATVCHRDADFCYMAVVDTPTGDVMGSNEFAVRGRVAWGDGSSTQKGWWVRFQTPHNKPAVDWIEERTPLVDWSFHRRRGNIRRVNADQLAVFGRELVFQLPVPTGIRPCPGR